MTAYDTYLESEILSADPVRLVQILYRAAIDQTRSARRYLAAGDIEARGRAVSKTSAILLELAGSLDHGQGAEFSRRLAGLYEYMLQRLSDAHLTQMDAPLAEVEKLLGDLVEAWGYVAAPEPAASTAYAVGDREPERVSCLC